MAQIGHEGGVGKGLGFGGDLADQDWGVEPGGFETRSVGREVGGGEVELG